MSSSSLPNIFSFDNYHAFIKAWFEARARMGRFTLGDFAALLGEAHRSFPHGVMATDRHQKKLKPQRARAWAAALGLGPDETTYLVTLAVAEGAAQEVALRTTRVEQQSDQARRERAIAHLQAAEAADQRLRDELAGWRRLHLRWGQGATAETLAAQVQAMRVEAAPLPRLLIRESTSWSMPPGWSAEGHHALGEALERLGREGADFRPLCRFYRLIQADDAELLPRIDSAFRQLAARLAGRFQTDHADQVVLLRMHMFPLTAPLQPRHAPPRAPTRSDWDIYDFDDHLVALRAWFAANPIPMSRYAELAGLRDRTLPRKVLEGEEALTPALALDFVRGMELSQDEDAYFVLLVAAARGDDEERSQAADRARAARTVAMAQRVRRDLMRLCRDWEHFVLFELTQVGVFRQDVSWLGALFRPPLPATELQRTLESLVRLGILTIGDDGRCLGNVQTLIAMTWGTRDQEVNAERHAGHQRLHARAGQDVAAPEEGACLIDLLLPLHPAQWAGVREELDHFAEDLLGLCQGTVRAPDRVFHIGIEAIPCTAGEGR